jgi:hypothetical protein
MKTVICKNCDKEFETDKKYVNRALHRRSGSIYCSQKCSNEAKISKVLVECKNCGTEFYRIPSHVRENNFCGRSCCASYTNKNKSYGTRVSKLEKWIQKNLTELYPDLYILYNEKDAIRSELDIYVPSLNIAFELNGIFHYEPIFGKDKLRQIENNDNRKFQACLENNIELCIIDTSAQKYFKESTSKKFLNIITEIINTKAQLLE